ncbi:MAG: antibiotic biosynthesis monooxygenase family protein [Janthinobacterium lividum]
MAVVIVEWRIKKGMDEAFLDYWATEVPIADRSGLIGEFLCKDGSDDEHLPWVRWNSRSTPEYTVYMNVGLWRDETDFAEQIGRYVDIGRPNMPFEYDRRQRILIDPVEWRRGPLDLPAHDTPGVL